MDGKTVTHVSTFPSDPLWQNLMGSEHFPNTRSHLSHLEIRPRLPRRLGYSAQTINGSRGGRPNYLPCRESGRRRCRCRRRRLSSANFSPFISKLRCGKVTLMLIPLFCDVPLDLRLILESGNLERGHLLAKRWKCAAPPCECVRTSR